MFIEFSSEQKMCYKKMLCNLTYTNIKETSARMLISSP